MALRPFDRGQAAPEPSQESLRLTLQALYDGASRRGGSFSVLVVGLDVAQGESADLRAQVVTDLASAFRESLRASDLVVERTDGSIVILLPGAAGRAAALVAERLRRTAEAGHRTSQQSSVYLTVSVGLAEFSRLHLSADAVLEAAEAALEAAREGGGNAVSLAS